MGGPWAARFIAGCAFFCRFYGFFASVPVFSASVLLRKPLQATFPQLGRKKLSPFIHRLFTGYSQAIHRQSTGIPLALWIAPPGHVVENPLSPYSGPDRTAPATAGVGDARATSASAKATPAPLAVRISRSRRSEDSCMAFLGDRSRPAGPAPRPGRMHQEGPIMKSAQPISNEVLGVWTKPGVI